MRALFIGLTTVDIQYFVDSFPGANVKIKTPPPDIILGGPATNAAVAFAFLNDGAKLISATGENPFKTLINRDFKLCNIQHVDLMAQQAFNPVLASVITAKNGDRNIFTHNPEKIVPKINPHKLLGEINPDAIMIDGFYPEFSNKIIKIAKASKVPVIADCGSWKPQYEKILSYVDYAICSGDFLPPGCSDPLQVINFLQKSGINKIAITRGEKPILFSEDGDVGEIYIHETEVVDTLGAGDFFHGAFTYYILNNTGFKASLQKAAALATFTCQYLGTRKWLKFANRIHFF